MKTASQNGNAIIWIFIAVGLFAALSYTFVQSSRTSTNVITDAQAQGYAQEIIAYGNEVKQAVKRLQLRGCSDTEISFENNIVSGYTNPNSPTSNKCHIFDNAGGGLSWQSPPGDLSQKGLGVSSDGIFIFTDNIEWDGVGTTCASNECTDLVMLYHFVDDKICSHINKQLNYSSMPQDTDFGGSQFIGNYLYINTLADEATGLEAQGEKTACFNRINGIYHYIYTHVILIR